MARQAYRASIFHLLAEPGPDAPPQDGYFEDGCLVIEDGIVQEAGAWADIAPRLGHDVPVAHFPASLIVPGFVDAHVHYPQVDMIAAPGAQLMDWLANYTFPFEARFSDKSVAREAASFFLDELLRNGTTTALVFSTVHRVSVEVLFEEALRRNMRIITGKVLMDRNAPAGICDTAETGYRESRALIETWHGKGRLSYAVTPRFAATSTERQLELAGRLLHEHPGVHLQTHLSENLDEIAIVKRLFPDCADYLGVYEKFGLVTERSLFAHGIHLSHSELHRMGHAHSAIAFCPTSNLFLGSGLFDLKSTRAAQVEVGLGTDVGGGTTLSMFQTMNEAYKIGQMRGDAIDPFRLFHLATLGGAKALRVDDKVGNFARGKEADFLVVDLRGSQILQRKLKHSHTLAEMLFALCILGDDRVVARTYVGGTLSYKAP